jgi:ABC-type sulfate transport system substrate-binding protein
MANYQFCILDPSLYPAIEQSMVVIKQTKRNIENERLMTAFADFITSQSAQSIIIANGYLIDE